MNTDTIHDGDGFGAGLLLGSLIGGLIGAGLALWYAPQTGKRTQHVVRTEATRLQKKANKQVHNIADQAMDKLEELQDQGRDLVDDKLNLANNAVGRLKQQVSR
jgi:gas vesicle protein